MKNLKINKEKIVSLLLAGSIALSAHSCTREIKENKSSEKEQVTYEQTLNDGNYNYYSFNIKTNEYGFLKNDAVLYSNLNMDSSTLSISLAEGTKLYIISSNGEYDYAYYQADNKYYYVKTSDVEMINDREDLSYLDKVAYEVYMGLWGNGDIRRQKLIDAGYDYDKVCTRVNQILGGASYDVNNPNNVYYDMVDTATNIRKCNGNNLEVDTDSRSLMYTNCETNIYIIDKNGNIDIKDIEPMQAFILHGFWNEYGIVSGIDDEKSLIPDDCYGLIISNNLSEVPRAVNYRIIVDKSDKILRAYDNDSNLIFQCPCSIGSEDHSTPVGIFHIYLKLDSDIMQSEEYKVNVNNVMYYKENQSDPCVYAIHAGDITTNSHGCTRVSYTRTLRPTGQYKSDIEMIYDEASVGDIVFNKN